MNAQPTVKTSILDNPNHYDSGFLKDNYVPHIQTISKDASIKLSELSKTNPVRARYLSILAARKGLKLGGQSTKKTNKNKKKLNLGRRYSKKNKKSMTRK
jgi:hypothetical protein